MRGLVAIAVFAACSYEHPARIDAGDCDPNACGFNASCMVGSGGVATCTCNPAYSGDGTHCESLWMGLPSAGGLAQTTEVRNIAAVGQVVYVAEDYGDTGSFFKAFDISMGAAGDVPLPPVNANGVNDFGTGGFTQVFVALGSSIYLFGNDGAVLDTTTNTWTVLGTSYPTTAKRDHAAGVSANRRVYLIGGQSPNEVSTEYFDGTQFTLVASLPHGSATLGAFAVGTKIYAFGSGPDQKETYSLDTTSDSNAWAPLMSSPQPLVSPTVAQFGGTLLVLGERGRFIYPYVPATNTWGPTFGVPDAGNFSWRLVTVDGGTVIALGVSENGNGDVVLYKLARLP